MIEDEDMVTEIFLNILESKGIAVSVEEEGVAIGITKEKLLEFLELAEADGHVLLLVQKPDDEELKN